MKKRGKKSMQERERETSFQKQLVTSSTAKVRGKHNI